jgi:hypothetical protein
MLVIRSGQIMVAKLSLLESAIFAGQDAEIRQISSVGSNLKFSGTEILESTGDG